jgi:hypothetical protein
MITSGGRVAVTGIDAVRPETEGKVDGAEMGRQGEAMGIFSSVQSLAQVPASILVGYIATSITSATPLIVSGACISAGGLLFLLAFKPKYVSGEPAAPGAVPVH